MSLFLFIAAALLLDHWFGEPRRGHPLVGFGRWAAWLEQQCNQPAAASSAQQIARGCLAWFVAVVPVVLASVWLSTLPLLGSVAAVLLLYLAIGGRSLELHGIAVRDALLAGDVMNARRQVGRMVSRDTDDMQADDVMRATVESILENGADAVFAALFWFVVAGAPGVVLYRLVNTLDAMWGYRNKRYRYFGRFAARADDVMNFIPARLCALTYALAGNFMSSLTCWRNQGGQWESPNAGPVMAAGAGALGIELGGAACYHGRLQSRPVLGCGRKPVTADIDRSLLLVKRGVWVWLATLFFVAGVLTLA